jgi:ribosomal-protein-alanine N-acetyltransferase
MSSTPHPDVAETRRVITELFNVGGERIWLIQLRDTGEIIGTCGFRPLAPHSRDFGYCLGPRWWGRGITPEVTRLLIAEMESDPTVFCSTPRRSGDNAHMTHAQAARGDVPVVRRSH